MKGFGVRSDDALGPADRQARKACVHFVWFRGDEYLSAVRVWGPPDFIHRGWDRRARREIAEGDTVIFAKGPHDQEPRPRNFDDIAERAFIFPQGRSC